MPNPADETPHLYLTAIEDSAEQAHTLTRFGRTTEALEHVDAIDRLTAAYRNAVGATVPPAPADTDLRDRIAEGSGHAAEAELYVLLRKAGQEPHAAQALIDRHRDEALRRMADEAQQTEATEIGDLQLSIRRGIGVTVDTAPRHTRIGIENLAAPNQWLRVHGDLINIGEQVCYRITGYDAQSMSLMVGLVEDWRPEASASATNEEA